MKINENYEDEKQEFKTSLGELDKGIDSLAAMLNKHCKGTIYFGVDNSGEVVGLKDQLGEEPIKKVSSRIQEILKPTIIPEVAFDFIDNKRIIKLSAQGNNRPYSSRGKYLIRVGSENKKIDPDLLGDLFFASEKASIENLESINQDLKFNELKQMYANAGLTINEKNFEENLHLKINGKYNYLANLLADENDISIKVVRFSGIDKLHMVSRNEYGFKCLFIAMKQASDYISSINETRVDIESSLERKEIHLFDEHVFDEAWTNACLHNKWIRNVPPAIYIFDNRIEIISTGGLPFDYSKESFYAGVSRPVNPSLERIMGQLNLIEQTGHGNLTIIAKYGKKAFNIGDSYINVTIPFAFIPTMASASNVNLSLQEQNILKAIKNHPTYSVKQIAELVNLGTTRVNQIIRILKENKLIERVGSNKSGYWKIK